MTDAPAPEVTPLAVSPPAANAWWRPPMRDVLAVASTALIAAAFLAPMFKPGVVLDQEIKGAILLQWGLVMGYYFGTSKTSVAKDKAITELAASGQ